MANPFDVRLADLPAAEREEVAKVLAVRVPSDVWDSDEGDVVVWYLFLGLILAGGIVAAMIEFSLAEFVAMWKFMPTTFPYGLLSPMFGGLVALLLLPLLVRKLLSLHGRTGWMVTSFGLVRMRGPRLRVARWPDITRLSRERIGTGRSRFVMVRVTTSKGVLACDTGALYREIARRVPSTTVVADEMA